MSSGTDLPAGSAVTQRARVRPMLATDVAEADRVMRTAFGTYLGMPEPERFAGDAEIIRTRAQAPHTRGFVAEIDGEVVGSSMASRWGSFGLFGPLTVHPSRWDAGIGKQLLKAAVDQFDAWRVELAGLFTFPDSAKHIGLYQRYGFYPRALTALMQHDPTGGDPVPGSTRLSAATLADRATLLHEVDEVCAAVYDGLDLTGEITALTDERLGDVVIIDGDNGSEGFAVCHLGAGSEAGSGACYVKFAAVRPGPDGSSAFSRLLAACEAMARQAGAATVMAGVNTARQHAYQALWSRGYRPAAYGVAMHRPNQPGFSRTTDLVLDDWR